MRPLRRTSLLVAALVALAAPAHAIASPSKVIQDCARDGRIDGHYSRGDLANARKHIPTDVDEYTDCRSAIEAALASGPGGTGGSHAPASSNPQLRTPAGAYAANPADLAAYRTEASRAGKGGSPSINIGGENVSPAAGGLAKLASAANALPLPLTIALIAVAALIVAGILAGAWRRWPQIRRAPLRLLRR